LAVVVFARQLFSLPPESEQNSSVFFKKVEIIPVLIKKFIPLTS